MSVSELQPADSRPRSTIRTGRLAVNLDTRVMSVDNRPLALTAKEYRILELLSLRKGTVLTKEMLLDHLYAGTDEPELKIIDVFVCKLRKKLAQATGGNHYIETVWGRGYSLRDPTEAAVPQKRGQTRVAALNQEDGRRTRNAASKSRRTSRTWTRARS